MTGASIAKECGYTKQALSKSLVELRDSLGISAGMGKKYYARNAYRDAQLRLVSEGRHAKFTRADSRKKAAEAREAAAKRAELAALEGVSD